MGVRCGQAGFYSVRLLLRALTQSIRNTADTDTVLFPSIIVTDEDDDDIVVFCARLSHIQQGFRFIRLLDEKGKDSHATLLANFAFSAIS